jgi:hypothetical protein
LVIETPSSPTPDADAIVDHFTDATLGRIDARDPDRVADLVQSWWANR